jgi:hypothetical protein
MIKDSDATKRDPSTTWWNWLPVSALLVGSLSITVSERLSPVDPHKLLAVFPPWWSAERSLQAAADVAPVIGFGAFPFLVAVNGDSQEQVQKLYSAGAYGVIDGSALQFCGASS